MKRGHASAARRGNYLVAALWGICVTAVHADPSATVARTPADLPAVERLPVIASLPDPFLFDDGSRVVTVGDWKRRREEIKAVILNEGYGHMPPPPADIQAEPLSQSEVLGGIAQQRVVRLKMGPDHKVGMRVRLVTPKEEGRWPVIILNANNHQDGSPVEREIIERGFALAVYNRTDLDPDRSQVVGVAQRAYPDFDWATLSVWAWGGMRTLDYLESIDDIDAAKAVITGHSRGGKTALLAGALDERFAVVVPNGSGCGGSGCFRVMGDGSESLEKITEPDRFEYWFNPRLREFAGHVDRLPFDAHFLKGLVAPRGLLSTDATGDHWANPLGTQVTFQAAQEVFDFLDASDRNAQTMRPGGHQHAADDWRALLDFADYVFRDKVSSRDLRQKPFQNVPQHYDWQRPGG